MDNTTYISQEQSPEEKKARIAAMIFAILLIGFVLYPFWSYPFPPPSQEGILVSFGEVKVSGNSDAIESQSEEVEKPDDGEKTKVASQVFRESKPSEKAKVKPKSAIKTKAITQEKSEVAVQKEVPQNIPSEAEKKEAKKISEAELKKAAEAKKKAEYEKAKKQFGDILGKGKGNQSESGNAGDPAGDPNTSVLDGLSKGTGKIGGGLASRGTVYIPEIDENSQKAGKVVVRVCVNNKGEVIEAKYTQKGSTTTDTDLVNVAIKGAKRYRFSKSPIEKQCGSITIEFKLK